MSKLTNKTFVMVVAGFGRIELTEKEAVVVKLAMDDPNIKSIEVGEGKYRVASIHGLDRMSQIESHDKIRKGQFQCEHGYWHQYGQICNCAEGIRFGIIKSKEKTT